jgi:hypothetical protein
MMAMADQQAISDSSTPARLEGKARPPRNPARRVTLIVIAIGVVLFFYGVAAVRAAS